LQDLRQRAQAEYERGAFDLAARHIRVLLETQPEEPSLMSLLARSMANQGDLDGAEVQCLKAIKMDKLNPAHRDLYATIVHELGRDEDAIRSLQESIYLNPDVPLSHFLLASLARRRGNDNQADKHFRWALDLLARYPQLNVLPESDGMTAGRLAEIIQSVMEANSGHEHNTE
jgi:chemotaxis protein methyltransferase CheR